MRKDSKNRRNLSNEDIKKKIERLNLEKQLKDLTEENVSPGKKMVTDILTSSGKKVATSLVTSMATGATVYAIRAAMTKEKMTMKEAADYVVPSRKKT
jgi:type I restriction-modification system DNA methylase subunit